MKYRQRSISSGIQEHVGGEFNSGSVIKHSTVLNSTVESNFHIDFMYVKIVTPQAQDWDSSLSEKVLLILACLVIP